MTGAPAMAESDPRPLRVVLIVGGVHVIHIIHVVHVVPICRVRAAVVRVLPQIVIECRPQLLTGERRLAMGIAGLVTPGIVAEEIIRIVAPVLGAPSVVVTAPSSPPGRLRRHPSTAAPGGR